MSFVLEKATLMDSNKANLPYKFEREAFVSIAPEVLFAHLDDHYRLSSHMSESSWMMGGGKMMIEMDAAKGKAVGSRIRLSGRVCGVSVAVEEVVTERIAPTIKAWETVGTPHLLVIGNYRMGFQINPESRDSKLRIFIEYALPQSKIQHLLGLIFGRFYARWCIERMVQDAIAYFENQRLSPFRAA
jgi:hypothetical protein